MVNFKLGQTNVKMNSSACHERVIKKKSESPRGFESMNAQTPGEGGGGALYPLELLSYGELMESEAIY